MIIQVATSDGPVTVDDAEAITVGGMAGVFAVHERILEARDANTVFDNWTVTHIQTGCAFSRGMTKEKAIAEAESTLAKIGAAKLRALAAKWPVISGPWRAKQASLFEEQAQ